MLKAIHRDICNIFFCSLLSYSDNIDFRNIKDSLQITFPVPYFSREIPTLH